MDTKKLFLCLAVAFLCLFTSGCLPNNERIKSSRDSRNTPSWPLWIVGNPSSKNGIVFVWSHKCANCREIFSQKVWPYFVKARNNNDSQVVFIENETQSKDIENEVDALCKGEKFYAYTVYRYLLSGENYTTIKNSHKGLDVAEFPCDNKITINRQVHDFIQNAQKEFSFTASDASMIIMGENAER